MDVEAVLNNHGERLRHLETLEELMSNIHGWDGSTWHKLSMVWGYSDRYAEYEYDDNVSAGTHYLTFSTVPTGEVWMIMAYLAYCSTANPAVIRLSAVMGGTETYLDLTATVVADTPLKMTGCAVLKEGDYLRAAFVNCSLNDDIRAHACGYKMKVNE